MINRYSLQILCFFSFCLSVFSWPSYSQKFEVLKNPIEIHSIFSQKLDDGQTQFSIDIEIANNHFLYVDNLNIISELNGLNNSIFDVEASPIIEFQDKFSNNEIKRGLIKVGQITFKVPLGFDFNSKFKLVYTACTKDFCYLPKTIDLDHRMTPPSSSPDKNLSILGNSFNLETTPLFLIFLLIFVSGILTSFTPCIFPVIPMTLTLIKNNVHAGRFKALQKTLFFVLGIAWTYSSLGVIAAWTGSFFGSLLSNPFVLISIGALYILMALSMMGTFEIHFFKRLENKFSKMSTQNNWGVFGFGLITGIFASPCVGPVLIGILAYAAQTQNMILSFFLLFTYAIGLGQIFILLSLFSELIDRLPRSGNWLNGTKYILALLLLGVGLFFAIPGVKGLLTSSTPKYSEQLEKALQSGQYVIVDFKASWCTACKELEIKTFKNPQISEFFSKNIFIPIDVTTTTPDTQDLLKKYKVMGLPHVLFFDRTGKERPQLTLKSFVDSQEMLKRIEALQNE